MILFESGIQPDRCREYRFFQGIDEQAKADDGVRAWGRAGCGGGRGCGEVRTVLKNAEKGKCAMHDVATTRPPVSGMEAELAACEFRRGGGCPPERKDPDWMSVPRR